MKRLIVIVSIIAIVASCSFAEPVKHGQCYTSEELTTLDKENVAGGKGTSTGSSRSFGTMHETRTQSRRLAL